MSIFGGLLGAGGSLLGGLFDGDGGVGEANSINARLNSQIRDLFREMGQRESLYFRDATNLFQDRFDTVMGSLDRSEAQVGQGTRASLRNANDQSQQAQASIQHGLRSRGLGNSSLAANAQRGIASDLSRNVGDIYAREGQIRSGLGQARAGFQSSLMGDQANLPLMRNSSTQNRLSGLVAALQEMAAVPSGETGGLGALGGALGGFLGGNDAENFGDIWGNITDLFG